MVRRARREQTGVTLIELMVCILITLLLAAAATPFALAWSHQSSVRQTQAQLQQGLSQLKAIALRNPMAARTPNASATLVTRAGQLCLHAGEPAALTCEGALWQSLIPAAVTVAREPNNCVALDSNGLPIDVQIDAQTCRLQPTFLIRRGNEQIELIFN
ncbi:hypothetical protein DBR47_13225 [Paucibacter sp. KBW04]|uniref:prepilin-type N-terminal cleavage/methylation domain-containing protein n=1 Tax=Paucibacter sp. KBW04 TaxID=2153361 RepID=UPI000F579666|nr:prepilin-type N-terminal cleavage/methylation domain-containing protein [Paucibacter sp. KBW04]RQO58646.1 hypothetical protein DBR47_13225 [Paucibacter sp. KBW04]